MMLLSLVEELLLYLLWICSPRHTQYGVVVLICLEARGSTEHADPMSEVSPCEK